MSLMRLLTAGKSLVGMKDDASRYVMGDPRMMPKFNSTKNSGGADQKPGVGIATQATQQSATLPSPSRASTVSAIAPAKGELSKAPVANPPTTPSLQHSTTTPSKAVQGLAELVPPGGQHSTQPGAAPGKGALDYRSVPGGILRAFFNRFPGQLRALVRRKPVSARRSGDPRTARPPVQGELSLDNIKVVRNDLTDADLEVVPCKAAMMNSISLTNNGDFGAASKAGPPDRAEPERSSGVSGRPNDFRSTEAQAAGSPVRPLAERASEVVIEKA